MPALLALGEEKVGEHIRTIGLWRNKAKNVIELSRLLIERHGIPIAIVGAVYILLFGRKLLPNEPEDNTPEKKPSFVSFRPRPSGRGYDAVYRV